MVTLEQARAAQKKAEALLFKAPSVNGIGISKIGEGYGIRVMFEVEDTSLEVPTQIDGVPVETEIVGRIVAY